MKFCTLFLVVALSVLSPSVLSQKLSIVEPKAGTILKPGSKLNVKLVENSYALASTQVAWTFGLKAKGTGKNIYLGNVGYEGVGATQDKGASQKTWTWTVTLPSADKFGNGIGQDYRLVLSQYFLTGATNTPTTTMSDAAVKIEKHWDKAL